MLYLIIRPLLLRLPPEMSHWLVLLGLKLLYRCRLISTPKWAQENTPAIKVFGIRFPNRVGLAAGFDKNGDYIDALAALGFGFIEIGTVTPRPQVGHAKPRLFRLKSDHAVINRMGFNNKGVIHLVEQVKKSAYTGILGINIGKNVETPIEQAVDDYLYCFRRVYPVASYIVINISSPNTQHLRQLQQGESLSQLLSVLKQEQHQCHQRTGRYVPLVIKISPDLSAAALQILAHTAMKHQVEGIIATNTTLSRQSVITLPTRYESGGLSGGPLTRRATDSVTLLHAIVGDDISIIASGGIMSAYDAKNKIRAGASLVQLYTGMIYTGPRLIRQVTRVL